MTGDPGAAWPQAAAGRRDPLTFDAPVVELLVPMPLELFGELVRAVGETLELAGYAASFREATGLGVIWARRLDAPDERRPHVDPVPGGAP